MLNICVLHMHTHMHVQTCRYTFNALICLHIYLHEDTCIYRQRDTTNHQQVTSKIRGRWPALGGYWHHISCSITVIVNQFECHDGSMAIAMTAAIRMPILTPIASWFYVPIAVVGSGPLQMKPHR